jgi:hypothetical protein
MYSIYTLPLQLLDVNSVVQTTAFHSHLNDQHHPTCALVEYKIGLAGRNPGTLVYLKYNK